MYTLVLVITSIIASNQPQNTVVSSSVYSQKQFVSLVECEKTKKLWEKTKTENHTESVTSINSGTCIKI